MRDGRYTLMFTVDGFEGRGWLESKGNRLAGGDHKYKLHGRIEGPDARAEAHLHIAVDHQVTSNSQMPAEFAFVAAGTTVSDSFSFIGTGPLGIIIEVTGRLTGEALR